MMYVPLGFNNRVQILMVALMSGRVWTFLLTLHFCPKALELY